MEPNGKVALVTGGGSGIGRATCIALAREGAAVVVADLNGEAAHETVQMIEGEGKTATGIEVDVTKRSDIERMVEFAERTYGGLDIAHNNAGIGTPRPRFPDARPEDWERTMTVDLWAVIACVQAEVPAMRKRGGGVIVNTASMAGIIPYAPDPIYNAAKHGVVGLTRGMAALKLEDNIRVNCICPGVVDTPMIRAGLSQLSEAEREMQEKVLESMPKIQPDEIADAVLALIRDDELAGEAMGIMPGRPPKLIPPAIRFGNDPAQGRR
jgi:NAD(P)-dependent dehydrogenase (short-subunit alcohol dehydrogenase family)